MSLFRKARKSSVFPAILGTKKKTRLADFLEKHPAAPLIDGYPMCTPASCGYCAGEICCYCQDRGKGEKWCWGQEVQEDEAD